MSLSRSMQGERADAGAAAGAGHCQVPSSAGGCVVLQRAGRYRSRCCRDFAAHVSGKSWEVGEAAGKAARGREDALTIAAVGAAVPTRRLLAWQRRSRRDAGDGGGVRSRAASLPSLTTANTFAPAAAILDDPMECSRGERLSITLAKNRINRAPERVGKAKVEVDIFELLRDSEYETAETSEYSSM